MSRAGFDPELKPLQPNQRDFINLIAYKGLDRIEAYCQVYNKTVDDSNRESIRVCASKIFHLPQVHNYYQAVMEEIRDNETKKGVWTKEVATEKLMNLIERAEQDIYGDEENDPKQITMSRLNAILLPIKELNMMNGFNQTNLNIDGQVVQICGESEIPE